jgi:hypothetical protein
MGYFLPGGGIVAAKRSGLNQTDVFSVDQNGNMNVSWVTGGGEWQGPQRIGQTNNFVAGSPLAACQELGRTQTDLFAVDKNGQLNYFWYGPGFSGIIWGGPATIGSVGLATPAACVAASPQFGAKNQLDVFLVTKEGQLNVFWINQEGRWDGPVAIGSRNFAYPEAGIAVSQHFGLNRTDVFVVDKNGQLNVFWVDSAGAWNGPQKIGTSGFAKPGSYIATSQQFGVTDQTDVFLVDTNGQLNVFTGNQAGAWSGPAKIGGPGTFLPASYIAASQQFGATNQTDVFLVDKNGQLNVFWANGAGPWRGPEKLGARGFANPGLFLAASQQFGQTDQTDVFLIDENGRLNVFWVESATAWQPPLVRGDPVPPPGRGLASAYNYILDNSGQAPLKDVSVTIFIEQDIVCEWATGPTVGFSFQLNAYSFKGPTIAWQQYVIIIDGSTVGGWVNNWVNPSSGPINQYKPLMTSPVRGLPAGYTLKISLHNDTSGNITGATFAVIDDQGHTLASELITITLTSDDTSIDAFQLDLVGPKNNENASLRSGSGQITYSASNLLTPLNQPPSKAAGTNINTAEVANSAYGLLCSSPSHTFTQSFSVTPVTTPPPTYNQIVFNITTGGDDLRGDSSATASVVIAGETQTFTLKAQSDPAWPNNSNNVRTFTIAGPAQPLSNFGNVTITLTSHNSWFQTDDNWNIQSVSISLSGPNVSACLLSQSGNPLARLTGSGPSVTLQAHVGC